MSALYYVLYKMNIFLPLEGGFSAISIDNYDTSHC